MEPHPLNTDPPAPVPRGRGRRNGWIAIGAVAGIAVALTAISMWHSRSPEACYRRGRRALENGDLRTALRESRRLLDTPGYEPHGRLLSGLLLARGGMHAQALHELQHAAWTEATAVDALTAAAECCYALGDFTKTVEMGRAALAKDQTAILARRWLAAAYYDLGAMADAVRELELISTQAPDDPRSERLLGSIDQDNERFELAVGHYREALRRGIAGPDRAEMLPDLAEALVRLSRCDEAVRTLHDCNRTAATLTLEAECEHMRGHGDEAHSRLREAIDLDPRYFPARLNQGIQWLVEGRVDDAVTALEEAARLAPHSSRAHLQLSQAYRRRSDEAQAAEQLRLMHESQAVEREFSELNTLASERPADADVRFRTGALARTLGKPELARMWFRAALAIDPAHRDARKALAEIE